MERGGKRPNILFFFGEGGNQQQHPYNNYINGRERQEKYERQPTTAQGEDRHHGVHVSLFCRIRKQNYKIKTVVGIKTKLKIYTALCCLNTNQRALC